MALLCNYLLLKDPEQQIIAKDAVLLASVISCIIGYIILIRSPKAE